jgi:uncharacterized protein YraI
MKRNRAFQAFAGLALMLLVGLAGCSGSPATRVAVVPPTKTPKPTFTPTVAVTPIPILLPTATAVAAATPIPVSPTPAATATQPPAEFTANQNVNVRGGPGTNYPIIGQLKAGDAKKVMAKNDDASWLQFNYDGDPGWVSAALVTVNGSTDAAQVAQNVPAPPVVRAQPVVVQPAPAQPQPAAPAAPTAVPAPPKSQYPYSLVQGSGRCDPNEGTTYFNGVVRYPNNSLKNAVCVHINVYGPRQTKCSGCGGVGEGNWGFSPFGGSKPAAGTQVEIYVVSCNGVPADGQNPISGFSDLTPQSDKWVHTLNGGEQCTGITFVG